MPEIKAIHRIDFPQEEPFDYFFRNALLQWMWVPAVPYTNLKLIPPFSAQPLTAALIAALSLGIREPLNLSVVLQIDGSDLSFCHSVSTVG